MKIKYDVHIHSCLSPCGADDMTPAAIAGLALLGGLDLVALTDHNSAKNCAAFERAAKFYGIASLCGLELTTAEDVHVLCLFETASEAEAFGDAIEKRRPFIGNRPDIFGNQIIMDETDTQTGTVEGLLISASDIGFDDVSALARDFGGIAIPSHIDKSSDSALAALGFISADSGYCTYELYKKGKAANGDMSAVLPFLPKGEHRYIVNSDAHMMDDIGAVSSEIELDDTLAAQYGIARAFLMALQ